MTPVAAFALAFDAGLSLLGASLVVGPVGHALDRPRLARLLAVVPFLKVAIDVAGSSSR